ncbi:putative DNA-binding transcriptional regulator YafY [Mycetocola sp. CAN_C7]|uniref:helix-turn-helix transcriptional regulator n=1 Tax=Mycetocola sp. CAN_C7 TaxID=2787724 RepID=UPI0018CBC08F
MSHTTSRALELLTLLQTHRHWPGPELAGRLGVTARTLRRDIERLRELGYTVTATRGSIGGYQLEGGADMPPLLLTDDEAVALAIGLRSYATEGIDDGELTALTALAKLEQLLPPELRRRVNALADVQPMRRPDVPRVPADLLGQLALACRDRDRIRFHYQARNGAESERLVEPHSIVSSSRYWFLVAWDLDRDAWRTFRVDRTSRFFNTRVRGPERTLPAEDAAEFIQAAVSSLDEVRQTADVVMELSLDAMTTRFGPWSEGATAEGENATRWPIGGDSCEAMIGALAWVEDGVEYRIEGNPEFSRFVDEAARRMLRATSPATAGTSGAAVP